MSSGKWELKQQDTTTHLLEWPKSATLTAPNAGEDVEQEELSHSLLVGMQNGTATLEDSLVVSYKTKHTLPHDPAITPFGIYPKELKTDTTQKYRCFYNSFIHNCQNLEAIKMSLSRWKNKLLYIQTTEYYLALKR